MQALSDMQQQYVDTFPKNVPKRMVQGAALSAALNYVFLRGSGGMILGAASAALATLVEAAVRPLFKMIFPNDEYIALGISLLTAYAITTAAAQVVAPWLHAASITDLFMFTCMSTLAFGLGIYHKDDASLFVC